MIVERDILGDRKSGPMSKVVGLYQMFLRRSLEHFFPDGVLDVHGDRSFIEWDGTPFQQNYLIEDDPDGMGMVVEWFRTRDLFSPAAPRRFSPPSVG